MTRLEAFAALFGENADETASVEAVEALKDQPRPTPNEAADLDSDVLDRANDFCDNPVFQTKQMTAGPAKVILASYALSLKSAQTEVRDSNSEPAVSPQPNPADHVTRDPEPKVEELMGRNRNNWNRDNEGHKGANQESGTGRGNNQGQNQNNRGGKGNQGQNQPPVEASKPSSLKTSEDERVIMETDRWFKDRTDAEKLFGRIRNGDRSSVDDLDRWSKFLIKIRDSTHLDPSTQKHASFVLKLLRALRNRMDETDKPGYKERFVDGLPPPPPDPFTEIPQPQGQGNRFFHRQR